MTKKQFYFFLSLIFLFTILFLGFMFLESKPQDIQNTLIIGRTTEYSPPSVYFCPEDNCKSLLLSLISSASSSIDCAIYDISSKEISEALISKSKQGLKIRIVTDNQRSSVSSSQVGILKSSGINVLISPQKESYMHNKFCIFDNYTVLFGSSNFTDNSFNKSYNNILVFENITLANTLTEKFDSFFSGSFSKDITFLSKEISPNFNIFFCPNSQCEFQVLKSIKETKESIECMLYSFTLDSFSEQLILAKERGIDIKIILENQQITKYSEYEKLKANNIEIILDNQPFLMHNKFCIFDNQLLITGSMNFSTNGTNKNDESFVIIFDSNLALQYHDYFKAKWFSWNT